MGTYNHFQYVPYTLGAQPQCSGGAAVTQNLYKS